jgi:predicted Zn finger-like uncharacterized protein
MIVTCHKCSTRFRFDETVIQGEGAWLRCSRCRNIFFLVNPVKPETERRPAEEQTVEEPPREMKEPERQFHENRGREVIREEVFPAGEVDKEPGDLEVSAAAGTEKDAKEIIEDLEEEVPGEKDEGKPLPHWKKQAVYLVIVLLLGGVYFSLYTETGREMIYERIFGVAEKSEEVGPAQVGLITVRQRFVNNVTIGTMRVVEGTAINESSYPMTRVKVKGEITDAYTVVLGAQESYCGNILTDDELGSLAEEQIRKELANPQGSDVSNDRIAPRGQIPFMIVFTREPAGVVKAFVTPTGAERLLP